MLPDYGEAWFLDDPRRPYGVGDIIDVYRDPIRGCYAGFMKAPAVPANGHTPAGEPASTAGGSSWPPRAATSSAGSGPGGSSCPRRATRGGFEFYGVGGTIARGSLLIGFARMLRDDLPAEPGGAPEGIGWTALVTSRDGRRWERDDEPFFDRSPDPEAWDRAMAWIGCALPVGDEVFLYYGGYQRGHKVEPTKERQIGLARMPADRFVSRDAVGETPGRLLTVPLRTPEGGPRGLVLNAAAAAGGEIRVAVLDAGTGEVLPGYGLANASPVGGDGLALPVSWRDHRAPRRHRAARVSPRPRGDLRLPAGRTRSHRRRPSQAALHRRELHRALRGSPDPMNPPVKAGIVLECDRPWEDFRLTSYFRVVQDGDLCRMYYSCFSKDQWHTPEAWDEHAYLCYAQSRDGIRWEKPSLGIVEFEGSRENNIILRSIVDGTVFLDPRRRPRSGTSSSPRSALTAAGSGCRGRPTGSTSRCRPIRSRHGRRTASRTPSGTSGSARTWLTCAAGPTWAWRSRTGSSSAWRWTTSRSPGAPGRGSSSARTRRTRPTWTSTPTPACGTRGPTTLTSCSPRSTATSRPRWATTACSTSRWRSAATASSGSGPIGAPTCRSACGASGTPASR